MARASRIGEASMRRGIFFQSLMASKSSQRPSILEQFLRGAGKFASRNELKALFNKATNDAKNQSDESGDYDLEGASISEARFVTLGNAPDKF